MPSRRAHPLFSPFGCGTAILFVLLLGAVLLWQGGKPFNPGALSDMRPRQTPIAGFASHAEFEMECGRCHTPWQGITSDKCEACHTPIAAQRQAGDGLHGLLPDTHRCQNCHTEHAGREARLTQMSLEQFDHDRLTRFSLMNHQLDFAGLPMSCTACHQEGSFVAAAVDCQTCHIQAAPAFMAEHATSFGTACLDCHQGRGEMDDFDHSRFFVLDGAHLALSCQQCHAGQTFAAASSFCAACHAEPPIHAGQFGLQCERCHTTTAWTPAQLQAHTFPLDHGDEGMIPCQTCHTRNYTAYTCTNCHAHPEEEIREEHLKEGITEFSDCIACHPTGEEAED
ncbi:MAG: hypothetical protein KJ063_16545 [Anaerolineae bacterium]|nr:hypothetical protein [Anaerolineae bacterium]